MNHKLKEWIKQNGGMDNIEVIICTNTHSVIENENFYPLDANINDIVEILKYKEEKVSK